MIRSSFLLNKITTNQWKYRSTYAHRPKSRSMKQHEANLQTWENQMMTQFLEMMTLFKTANSVQSTDAPKNNKMANATRARARARATKNPTSSTQVLLFPRSLYPYQYRMQPEDQQSPRWRKFSNMLGSSWAGWCCLQAWKFASSDSCLNEK